VTATTTTTADTGGLGSRGTGSLFDSDAVDAARGVEEPGAVQRALGDLRRSNPADDIRTQTDTASPGNSHARGHPRLTTTA